MELSGKDIIGIIKAAGESGVKSLRLGEVEISWRDDIPELIHGPTIDPSNAPWREVQNNEPTITDTEKTEVDEELEEYSDLLMDPGAWEKKELEE